MYGIWLDLRNSLVTTEENLSIVLIQGTLVVGYSGHILDHDAVIGVLALLVENMVGFNHVIHDIGLGDLLGAELLMGAQVLTIVVTQVIVAGDGGQLDAGTDEEVNKSGFHLGLARLEVISANVGIVLLRQLNSTGNKGVLGRSVDKGSVLKDTGHGENGGGGDLLMALLNRLEEVISGIIHTLDDVGITFGVGRPHHDDFVKTILFFELSNVFAQMLNVGQRSLATLDQIVGTVLLVGSNEVRVVNGRQWDVRGHFLLNQSLEAGLQNLGTIHSLSKVQLANVPAANDKIIGVDHGQDLMERNIDILVSFGIGSQLHCGAHDNGAIVIGLLLSLLGRPDEVAAVGNDTGGDSRTVVTAPADKHHTGLGHLPFDLEVVQSLSRGGHELAIRVCFDLGSTIGVLGLDFAIRISDIGRVDCEDIIGGSLDSAPVSVGVTPVSGSRMLLCVRGHVG